MNFQSTLSPILSVIMPTKNRMQYATSAIESVLGIPSQQLELVIYDTSNSKELEVFLNNNIDDKRLHYTYTPLSFTFSETFNNAVLLSHGEYVCIIGDDDGINPEIVDATIWAKEQGIDALIPSVIAVYGWPDFRHLYYGDSNASKLQIRKFTSSFFYPNIEHELEVCAKKAFQDFGNLPKIYYGIVKRQCLDQLYKKTGAFFFGSSPDISGAIAIASYVKKGCVIDYPLFLPGMSANSGAGRSGMKKHVGKLEDAHQTRPFILNWPNIIPRFYAVQTVWAHSALEALRATKRFDIIAKFNVSLFHSICLLHNPNFYKVIIGNLIKSLRTERFGIVQGIPIFLFWILVNIWIRVRGPIFKVLKIGYYKYEYILSNVDSIKDAVNAMSNYLKSIGVNFNFKKKSISSSH